jgi:hypothetical protein
MEAKALFKKLIDDAKKPTIRNEATIMSYGSQRITDFEDDKRPSRKGRFAHLTNEYIDGLTDAELEQEMVSFIYRCFQQR